MVLCRFKALEGKAGDKMKAYCECLDYYTCASKHLLMCNKRCKSTCSLFSGESMDGFCPWAMSHFHDFEFFSLCCRASKQEY